MVHSSAGIRYRNRCTFQGIENRHGTRGGRSIGTDFDLIGRGYGGGWLFSVRLEIDEVMLVSRPSRVYNLSLRPILENASTVV